MFVFCFFFFNDTATTEIYTLSLHDALPIFRDPAGHPLAQSAAAAAAPAGSAAQVAGARGRGGEIGRAHV